MEEIVESNYLSIVTWIFNRIFIRSCSILFSYLNDLTRFSIYSFILYKKNHEYSVKVIYFNFIKNRHFNHGFNICTKYKKSTIKIILSTTCWEVAIADMFRLHVSKSFMVSYVNGRSECSTINMYVFINLPLLSDCYIIDAHTFLINSTETKYWTP